MADRGEARDRDGHGRGPFGGRGIGLALAAWILVVGGCGGDPSTIPDCLPRKDLKPICRFHAPEDLAVVGHWLIVSQMPSTKRPGSLIAFHPATSTFRALYPPAGIPLGSLPAAGDEGDPAAGSASGDGGCAAGKPPPVSDFSPHGIDASLTRLLVVNHGSREAIEEFAIGQDATGLTLEWKSCTPLPPDASANDVVALPDGGFAATKMVGRPQWLGIAKLLLGMNTGALLRYSPATRTWETVPHSEGEAPNGVEVAPDGAFFVSEWTGHRVLRIEPDGSDRATVALDFSPDNLSWAADGRLLVAGQRAGILDVPVCAMEEERTCALPSVVVAIDPISLAVSPLIDDDPASVLGAASIAVELEGNLWIGSFAGNRLVKREGVH